MGRRGGKEGSVLMVSVSGHSGEGRGCYYPAGSWPEP